MTTTVEEIVKIEWELFDQVQNIGGRAACQDDWNTFFIMRSSQLEAWSPALRESYFQDLLAARAEGRNLLTEKYAYMMERTNPAEYAQIKDQLTPRTPEKVQLLDKICPIHVAWLEALAERYPRLAGRGRAIRRSEDSPFSTSFETYLWGELSTYSVKTLRLYAAYAEQLQGEGRNLNEMVLQNTVAQYGYSSMEAAEASLAQPQAPVN